MHLATRLKSRRGGVMIHRHAFVYVGYKLLNAGVTANIAWVLLVSFVPHGHVILPNQHDVVSCFDVMNRHTLPKRHLANAFCLDGCSHAHCLESP